MKVFHQEEPPNPPKRFKFLASVLKDAFSKCHSSRKNLSFSSPEAEEAATNFDEEEEVFVSAIITKYMESKSKRKSTIAIDSSKWTLSPKSMKRNERHGEYREDEFLSACSHLSRCSSATSFDSFVSIKTRFSRSSSLSKIDDDFQDWNKRLVVVDFVGCEGWPFGLCRRALLLPPLPKSPVDSWLWRKSGGTIKLQG